MEAVFWYNVSSRSDQDEKSVLLRAVFRYKWRHPRKVPMYTGEGKGFASIRVGEEVWVKLPDAKCITHCGRDTVTDVHSRNNLSIDGMPCHILNVRRVLEPSEDEENSNEQEVAEEKEAVTRRSQRER